MNKHAKVASISQGKMSDAEWEARVDLAAVYRLVSHYGWDDVIYNHSSMRVPGEPRNVSHEAARAALHRGDRLQSGEGLHGRGPRREGGRQPPRLHAARRRARRARRRQLRDPCAHRGRHGDRRLEERPAHGVAAGDPLLQAHRLSRLRGHHRGFRRARAHQQGPRAEPRHDHAPITACSPSARPRARPSC